MIRLELSKTNLRFLAYRHDLGKTKKSCGGKKEALESMPGSGYGLLRCFLPPQFGKGKDEEKRAVK